MSTDGWGTFLHGHVDLSERGDIADLLVGLDRGVVLLAIEEDHLAARVLEAERDMEQMMQFLSHGALAIGRNKKQKEATATRPGDLAPESASRAGALIELVDVGTGNRLADRAFKNPRFVEQASKLTQARASAQDGECFIHHVAKDAELAALLFQ